jgi:hypothetical protein
VAFSPSSPYTNTATKLRNSRKNKGQKNIDTLSILNRLAGHMKIKIYLALLTATLIVIPITQQAQINYTTGTYSQNFNSLTDSNLAAAAVNNLTMLEVSAQAGGGTANGWYLYGTGSTTRWGRSNGATTTGGFYGLRDGSGGLALGSLGSSTN